MMVASVSALIMVAISTNIVNVLLTMSRAESKCVEVRSRVALCMKKRQTGN